MPTPVDEPTRAELAAETATLGRMARHLETLEARMRDRGLRPLHVMAKHVDKARRAVGSLHTAFEHCHRCGGFGPNPVSAAERKGAGVFEGEGHAAPADRA